MLPTPKVGVSVSGSVSLGKKIGGCAWAVVLFLWDVVAPLWGLASDMRCVFVGHRWVDVREHLTTATVQLGEGVTLDVDELPLYECCRCPATEDEYEYGEGRPVHSPWRAFRDATYRFGRWFKD